MLEVEVRVLVPCICPQIPGIHRDPSRSTPITSKYSSIKPPTLGAPQGGFSPTAGTDAQHFSLIPSLFGVSPCCFNLRVSGQSYIPQKKKKQHVTPASLLSMHASESPSKQHKQGYTTLRWACVFYHSILED